MKQLKQGKPMMKERLFLFAAFILLIVGYFLYFPYFLEFPRRQVTASPMPASPRNATKKRALTFHFVPRTRLGNRMFVLASALGVAATNNMTLYLPPDKEDFKSLYAVFKLATTRNLQTVNDKKLQFTEIRTGSYWCESKIPLPGKNIRLNGGMQCFNNFATFSTLIAEEFSVLDALQQKATRVIEQIAGNSTTVGLHVRRGDFKKRQWQRRGLSIAPLSYFKKAMKFFTRRYNNVHFIVASNDRAWVTENLTLVSDGVTPTPVQSTGEDFAVLVNCEHIIISSGTFSWWAGWLNKGTVLYYKNYPRPNSPAWKEFNASEYYPQHWIGMA